MSVIDHVMGQLTPLYVGSVKTLFQHPQNQNNLLFHYTDDYSVFDWGKMPDAIETKGKSLCLMGAQLMQELQTPWQRLETISKTFNAEKLEQLLQSKTATMLFRSGLNTHLKAIVDSEKYQPLSISEALNSEKQVLMQVEKVGVYPPIQSQVQGQLVYDYPPLNYEENAKKLDQATFVPLEVIFRFGLPEGSSLLSRLQKNPQLLMQYGLKDTPKAGDQFDFPVVEFFSKLEGHDRLLTFQEAIFISQLPAPKIQQLLETCQLVSLWLYQRFQQLDIQLWDGKLEFAYHPERGFILVDTIGLDELRLSYKGVSLSKELLRDFYRTTDWYQQIKQVQEDTPEKFILQKDTLPQPPQIPTELKQTVEAVYAIVLIGLLPDSNLTEFKAKLEQLVETIKVQKDQLTQCNLLGAK